MNVNEPTLITNIGLGKNHFYHQRSKTILIGNHKHPDYNKMNPEPKLCVKIGHKNVKKRQFYIIYYDDFIRKPRLYIKNKRIITEMLNAYFIQQNTI